MVELPIQGMDSLDNFFECSEELEEGGDGPSGLDEAMASSALYSTYTVVWFPWLLIIKALNLTVRCVCVLLPVSLALSAIVQSTI